MVSQQRATNFWLCNWMNWLEMVSSVALRSPHKSRDKLGNRNKHEMIDYLWMSDKSDSSDKSKYKGYLCQLLPNADNRLISQPWAVASTRCKRLFWCKNANEMGRKQEKHSPKNGKQEKFLMQIRKSHENMKTWKRGQVSEACGNCNCGSWQQEVLRQPGCCIPA